MIQQASNALGQYCPTINDMRKKRIATNQKIIVIGKQN